MDDGRQVHRSRGDSSLLPSHGTTDNRETEARTKAQHRGRTIIHLVSRPGVAEHRGGGAADGGTYPEYDVESEDKILDAAAHFVSFKMLS